MQEIRVTISLDELRIAPIDSMKLREAYAGADLGVLAEKQGCAWLSESSCIFFYEDLPSGITGPLHLRRELFVKLKEISSDFAMMIQ